MKRYTVDCMNFYGGHFKTFWFKHSAINYANSSREPWVDITDTWTGKRTRIKNSKLKKGSHGTMDASGRTTFNITGYDYL